MIARGRFAACVLLATGLAVINLNVARARDAQTEKIVAGWQARQSWFGVLVIKIQGKHKIAKGSYSAAYSGPAAEAMGLPQGATTPPTDLEGPIGFSIVLDLAKGRHRRDITEQSFDTARSKLVSTKMTDAFNGSVMKCLIPKSDNPNQQIGETQPELTIVSGNMKNGEFRSDYYPIFFGIGRIHTPQQPILPGHIRSQIAAKDLYYHGLAVHKDRSCVVLRTHVIPGMIPPSFEEFWVDPSQEEAVIRYFRYSGRDPVEEISIDYQRFQDHWLPRDWSRTILVRGRVLYSDIMHVETVAVDSKISDSDFELDIKPNMLVEDRSDLPTSSPIETPASKLSIFRTQEDGTRVPVRDPAGRSSDTFVPQSQRGPWPWIASALGVVAAAVAVVVFRRHRAAKIASKP